MKKSTRQIIKILLEADDTIPIEHQRNIWEVVTNRPKDDSSLPLLLTQAQAAALLGMSRISVHRLVQAGKMPRVKILDCWRYHRADIEELARNGT
jgi:excisionase family DNA binding protein